MTLNEKRKERGNGVIDVVVSGVATNAATFGGLASCKLCCSE